ncbi:hypothetical protein NXV11_09105 [Bacteroides fragilis]|nr:hypothetical protein [Bacteroides fragilis]
MDIQQDNEKQNIRNRHIDIRLTEEEYKMVVEKAAECGLTLSNYGRKLLQNHHPSKRLSDEEVQGLNSLSDARADLIRIQNVLKGKPDEIKKRYFRDENYMRAWIEAVNRLIVRWWKIQCKLPPKTKRFCPLVLK